MEVHPTRFHLAGRRELRGRITAEIFKSECGRRVLEECLEALARAADSDEHSRHPVLARYADELSITADEMDELVLRYSRSQERAALMKGTYEGQNSQRDD